MPASSRALRAAMVFASIALTVGVAAQPAAAGRPRVGQPTPVAFSECHLRCVSPALLRTTTPTLTVEVTGTIGYSLYTDFEVRMAPSRRGEVVASVFGVGPVLPPTTAQWTVPDGSLSAETPYYWRARSVNDNGTRGAWSDWQTLTIDTTPPDSPSVASAEYPERQWGAVHGTEGTFHFSSIALDVVDFVSYLGAEPWVTSPASGTGPRVAARSFIPPDDLVDTLHVFALDAAGNRSDTRMYEFWVTPAAPRYAHWTLDDTAADSGNIGADSTLSGDVAFGPGYVGGTNGAVFTGAGGQIATADVVLDTTESFTVMAWVRMDDPSLGTQRVAAQGDFALYYSQQSGTWCASLGAAAACADAVPAIGEWTHVAARFDAISGVLGLYVMGEPEACGGERAETPASGAAATGQFVIGEAWRGAIDDVQAHQRALEGVEICQHASW